ncbi:tyrosine-type recombinase/integrase [Bacillus tianshenii]|uniref:tyrosine-type recombinase/integrase n=1 Tax=Sutcliffiella tianshenii TaxID=1463404 RepID=UPI001CD74FD6|nr:tyrosine-type recombinase/integrase [Bacillus tianshenii]MCA1321208.1 tyrosine-type recombinase/integrase [Bacillus tianshenii]
MEYVEALKDKRYIHAMKEYLNKHSLRDNLFFVMGINMGLRLSELLQLKVQDVVEGEEGIKEFYSCSDGYSPSIYINNQVRNALASYIKTVEAEPDDYLFKSKKCASPITRQQAYRIINHAAKEVGVPGKVGTHTLRKTFGYHAYHSGVAISILQKHFHHSSPSETLRYLGIKKEENTSVKLDVNL